MSIVSRENIGPPIPETEGVTFRKKLCWLLFLLAKRELGFASIIYLLQHHLLVFRPSLSSGEWYLVYKKFSVSYKEYFCRIPWWITLVLFMHACHIYSYRKAKTRSWSSLKLCRARNDLSLMSKRFRIYQGTITFLFSINRN